MSWLINGSIFLYKYEATERNELQELVNPPLECCEIVIWWKSFISEGVSKDSRARKIL